LASHRADTRAVTRRRTPDASAPSSGTSNSQAARRSTRKPGAHALPRTPRDTRRGLPTILSAPTLVGAAALALATVGSVTVGTAAEAGSAPRSSDSLSASSVQASALGGVSTDTSVLSGRERAVSRDSQRDALKDAAGKQLQAAAEKQAKERNAALVALAASAEKHAGLIAKDAWQLPVSGYHLTSRFGQCSSLWSHCHTGLDFAAAAGTPIKAVATGTVTEVGSAGAYGNRTIITLEDGTEMWYCHQTSYVVQTGQKVAAGTLIGSVGSTGNTTGPHLHLEVRPGAGDPVDPDQALVAHGLKP
jgi:murein DD-endopeptidase MepM/ murein hydrolase activator NlpD